MIQFQNSGSLASQSGYLEGQLLVATPVIEGPSFSHSVIFLCAHNENGAMGLIINHEIENISYLDLFDQLNIKVGKQARELPVHYGGPVEINRGFVIYAHDGMPQPEAMLVMGDVAISSSVSMLRAIADGGGPNECLLTLGYAGWAPGQLEAEIQANSWISAPATRELIFGADNDVKWQRAAGQLGVDMQKFSSVAGHA